MKGENERIFWIDEDRYKWPATINLVPGYTVYGEKTVNFNGRELRLWNPNRSKIGAALMKKMELPIGLGSCVLYLGAASGTTASHVSDIVGNEGVVYCVDISERTMRDLIFVCEKKKNMIPILGNASNPEEYEFSVDRKIDFVFQDVAAPEQIKMFMKNCKHFLKKGQFGMLAVKSRSIDVNEKPSEIFREAEEELRKEFEIVDKKRLEPFEMDHIMFLIKVK